MSLAVVLGIFCASIPFQTPPMDIEKGDARPFPCQNRPCGCRSADQCWKQCCCFTHSEKLAWAEANGVTPPEHLRGPRGISTATKGCGLKSVGTGRGSRAVMTVAAAGCQGQFWHWSAIPYSTPAPAAVELTVVDFGGYFVGCDRQIFSRGAMRPPVPPPRA